MKRETKFRGLRTDGNGWLYGSLVNNLFVKAESKENVCEIISTDDVHFDCWEDIISGGIIEVYPESVGQFTGLKDRHGKDIYEGDFLSIGVKDFGMMQSNYAVIFEGCDYILKRKDLSFNWGRLSRLSDMNWECEIVGNIHEN